MSNFEIKQQFVVDGQAFDTVEAAEAYIASNANRVRVVAFTDHLKANGAKRISKAVTEAIEQFIAFEEGAGNAGASSAETQAPAQATTGSKAPGKPASDTPTEKETSGASAEAAVDVEVSEPGNTSASSDQPSTEEAVDPSAASEKSAGAVAGGSKHVNGPDEELEEDPLAGLDLESLE